MSLTLRLDFVVVATFDNMAISSSDRATLEMTRLVGKGATDVRPSMFREVDVRVGVPSLLNMPDADAVWTAEVDSMIRELSGTLEGVTSYGMGSVTSAVY
jgi:hypothetical protein